MSPTEAQKISTSPDEVQDLQDDLVIHQQTEPEPEGEITKDIESNKPKRPRSEKQKAAFEKARKVLAEKRAAKAATKSQNKAKPGRPPKVKSQEVKVDQADHVDQVAVSKPARKGRKPKVRYVEMMPSSSSESSSESEPDEVVYVQRKKTKRKTKRKQDTRLVYVEDSSSDDDDTFPPPLTSLYSFV